MGGGVKSQQQTHKKVARNNRFTVLAQDEKEAREREIKKKKQKNHTSSFQIEWKSLRSTSPICRNVNEAVLSKVPDT